VEAAAVWSAVADERAALADLLDAVPDDVWARPSLCGEWSVHEVLAHLVVLAEGTVRSVMTGTVRAAPWSPALGIERVARRLAATAPAPALVARLRAAADGRFVVPGMPPAVALGEVVVHRGDITAAADLPRHPPDERVRAVLEAELGLWFAFGVPRKARRIRFAPTDADWSVGPPDGPVVEGEAHDLVLAATGRAPALAVCHGPGLAILTRT
jgi:uncharacterized protein (TIGR03083 family)